MDSITRPMLDPDTALEFLRQRRSIRNFRDELVPEEKIRQLLEAARFAPTAANSGHGYLGSGPDQKITDCG